jgi:hypothetical protein
LAGAEQRFSSRRLDRKSPGRFRLADLNAAARKVLRTNEVLQRIELARYA